MDHIPFELATAHRDELLRLAAKRRLLSRPPFSAELTPRAMPARRRHGLRRLRRPRLAIRG